MSSQALSAPISSQSLLHVQTQAARWKAAAPEQLSGAHLYLDIVRLSLSWLFWKRRIMWEKCPVLSKKSFGHADMGTTSSSSDHIHPDSPGPRFNIKMTSYQYRKSHCGNKTVVRSSYLHKGISYTGKMSSLYWIGALDAEEKRENSFASWHSSNSRHLPLRKPNT